jgi:hypothetical protein
MRTGMKWACTGLAVAMLTGAGVAISADKKQPKYAIKDVMKQAHKGGLLKKITSGEGDKADKQKLLVMYIALSQNKPPKGDLDDWKERTGKMVTAAKAVVDGKEGAEKKLASTVNCMACHDLHRPKE